jgi:hypothetical protein
MGHARVHNLLFVTFSRARSRLFLIFLGKLSLRLATGASIALTADGNSPGSELYTLYHHVYYKLEESLRHISQLWTYGQNETSFTLQQKPY